MNLLMLELSTLLLVSDSAGVVGTAKRWHGRASAAGVNAANVRPDILSRSLADPQLPDAMIDANAPRESAAGGCGTQQCLGPRGYLRCP